MTKRLVWMVMALGLVALAGIAVAGESNPFGVEWDEEAVAAMSKAERMAYQQQYKAAVEEAARQAGALPFEPKADRPARRVAPPQTLVPGSAISYHSGTLSASAVSSFSVGNRFDNALTTMGTAIGPVEMSGSITMVSFDMASVDGAAFVSFFDQLAGATANVISSMSRPAAVGSNVLTLTTAVNYVGTSFLAGIWNFGADVVNVATGTVGGQGFHGMSINDVNGQSFNAYTMTNGTVAVQGNVATPVELMSFSID